MGDEDSGEQERKFFLGGLDYGTTEDGLSNFFGQYGQLVDVVVMRFPDTKRSRGFGFVTFATADQAQTCYDDRPHVVDGKVRILALHELPCHNERYLCRRLRRNGRRRGTKPAVLAAGAATVAETSMKRVAEATVDATRPAGSSSLVA